MRRMLFFTLLAMTVITAACSDDDTAARNTIAYVYGEYATALPNVRTFLTNNGFRFMPVAVTNNEADVADYSSCTAILIDWNCFTNATPTTHWAGSDIARERIRTAGCFVLGFRYGGIGFYGDAAHRGIDMWFKPGNSTARDYTHAVDTNQIFWNSPNVIAFYDTNRCELYGGSQGLSSPYRGNAPADTSVIAQLDATYADIAVTLSNGTPFGFWGFDGDPYYMAENGRKLLLNILDRFRKR